MKMLGPHTLPVLAKVAQKRIMKQPGDGSGPPPPPWTEAEFITALSLPDVTGQRAQCTLDPVLPRVHSHPYRKWKTTRLYGS